MKNAMVRLRKGKSEIAAGFVSMLAVICLAGCGTFPVGSVRKPEEKTDRREATDGKNRLLALLPEKPILLLLHGATEDRMEMAALGREWISTHNVLLYSYNFHDHLEKIADNLVEEIKQLKARQKIIGAERAATNMTVVVYSYSAAVFRKAVLASGDETLFAGATLVQFVPTAGGSYQARQLENPIFATLVSRVSRPSAAENPYGEIAEEIWDDAATQKFSQIISPSCVHTFLVEDDSHSLAQSKKEEVRRRYENGIGTNVVIIPKSVGLTHEHFPTHPAAIHCLRAAMRGHAVEFSQLTKSDRGTNAFPTDVNSRKH